jgi:hypothetical protein
MSKLSKRQRKRKKQWEGHWSPAVQREENEVIARCGRTTIIRSEFRRRFDCDWIRSGRRITQIAKKYGVESANELGQMLTPEMMYQEGRVAEKTITVFGYLLIKEGFDPDIWNDDHRKFTSSYTAARIKLRKRRAKIRRKRFGGAKVIRMPSRRAIAS